MIAFIQEAKENGKSIVCDDKFKNWLTEYIQQIRKMRENPRDAPNYGNAFMWSNNPNCLKMTPAMSRRVMAVETSYDMIDINKPEVRAYFKSLWGILEDQQSIQNIFDWLVSRDISEFDSDVIPQTTFKEEMAADSMSYVQKFIIEVCNSNRSVEFSEKGVGKVVSDDLFNDYRMWCSADIGIADKFVLDKLKFRKEIASKMGIEYKKIKVGTESTWGHRIILKDVEMAMRAMLKNNAWELIKANEDVADSDSDD